MKYQKILTTDGKYARVTFPEMLVLKENASLKLLVDDEGQLLARIVGNTLPVDKTYRHLSGIRIQKKTRRREAYSSINIISHIISRCRSCDICKNNVKTDNKTTSKIKRALGYIISKEIKDDSKKNKLRANVTSAIIEKFKIKYFEKACDHNKIIVD